MGRTKSMVAALLAAMALVVAACAAPGPTPPGTSTSTTSVSTTTTTVTTPGGDEFFVTTTTASTETLTLTAYDANGAVLAPSSAAPLTVSFYGATGLSNFSPTPVSAAGADPVVVQLTSGTDLSFDYDGSFRNGPVAVQASMPTASANPCSATNSVALGAATVPLATAPTPSGTVTAAVPSICPSGTTGTTCLSEIVDTYAVRVQAAVGYGASSPTGPAPSPAVAVPSSAQGDYTIDTGSIGTAVPAIELGPNAVGPGAPAYKSYDSSGYQYSGYLYLAPVTFTTATGTVSTIPIRVLAVYSSACAAGASGCSSAPDPNTFHYMGSGFDRNTASPAAPLVSPTDSALLNIASDTNGAYASGYVVSATGVTVGATASTVSGFSLSPLTASTSVPGDWNEALGTVAITESGASPSFQPAQVLIDTGITEMIVDQPTSIFPSGPPADSTVAVTVNGVSATPALSYTYSSGPAGGGSPAAVGSAPSSLSLIKTASATVVSVNTGRHPLFDFDYLFDATTGAIGFSPLAAPLR